MNAINEQCCGGVLLAVSSDIRAEIVSSPVDYPRSSVFDELGGVLPHATYPTSGTCIEIHLDSKERKNFSLNDSVPDDQVRLLMVHESDALGQEHCNIKSVIMHSLYQHSIRGLDMDDKDFVVIILFQIPHLNSIIIGCISVITRSYLNNLLIPELPDKTIYEFPKHADTEVNTVFQTYGGSTFLFFDNSYIQLIANLQELAGKG
nr:unnamed protein product [Callosobruchus chinensis]